MNNEQEKRTRKEHVRFVVMRFSRHQKKNHDTESFFSIQIEKNPPSSFHFTSTFTSTSTTPSAYIPHDD